MPATNYKPQKPTQCLQCGKALLQAKHGRRLYCYACRQQRNQQAMHRFWERRRGNRPPTKNCNIDWETGNRLISEGLDPQAIAATLNCSIHTVLSHRCQMVSSRLKQAQPYRCEFYDYKAQLDRELMAAYTSPRFSFQDTMTFDEFRAWLRTDDGQAFLCMAQGHDDQYTDVRHPDEMDSLIQKS